jgi:hypothetical protein
MAVLETPQFLRDSVLQHFDILGPQVRHQLLMFIARDQIEQHFLRGGAQDGPRSVGLGKPNGCSHRNSSY